MDRNILRAGLLKGSFIPKHNIRASGFRLSAFLADIFGVAGMAILQVLVEVGSISEQSLTPCLKGHAHLKATEILTSLNGTLSLPQRQLLKMQLSHLVDLQENLQEVQAQIRNSFIDFEGSIELLGSIPGIAETAAFAILA